MYHVMLYNAWKRHQDAVYWVDIDLAIQKGLKFYQTRSNAIILQETQPVEEEMQGDPEFRNRMIENNRDEELCRKWDALADEDHTHHLTPQEYSFYKKNWWLHSNKQGSITVRVKHRPDFKQALSTLQQLKQKEEGALQTPTDSHRNQQWAQSSSSWWNWQGSWLTPYSYESHDEDETKY